MKRMLILAAFLPAVAVAAGIGNGEVVSLQKPGHRTYFAMDRVSRENAFSNATFRAEMLLTGDSPAPVALNWMIGTAPYEVQVSKRNGEEGDAGKVVWKQRAHANSTEVYNLEIARDYEWTAHDASGRRVGAGRFRTADEAPRLLRVPGIPNLRDLGGRIGTGGRRIRQCLIYRSAGWNDNARKVVFTNDLVVSTNVLPGANRLKGDIAALVVRPMGIRTDLDLRTDRECRGMTGSPLGPGVKWVHISSGNYCELSEEWARKAFARGFRVFLDEKNYPIVFHCIAGADRTGSLACILNALLGVDEDELAKDWEATGFVNSHAKFRHDIRWNPLIRVFDAYPGKTLKERIEAYVKSCGFADADIAHFRNIMMERPADGVSFVECAKCTKRIRISDDGHSAFVNLSRIEPSEKSAMEARARMLLERARPVTSVDPRTPLMGWSSWNTFAVDVSEEILLGVARAMSTNGLMAAGYAYVNLDDGFFWGHGAENRLLFHPKRFPKGLKGLVDGIHALGMKAGIYSDAGADTCGSMWNSDQGGIGSGLYGHDREDCQLHFGELGFDFIKVDYCGGNRLNLEERRRYAEIAEAIRATGRTDVRLNICRWAFPGTWAADIAGSWRTTADIRANWNSIRGIIAENLYLSAYASPGHFNDLDMLEVGQRRGQVTSAFGKHGDAGLTEDEETTHFGMWCILSSPLVLGNDVRNVPATTMKLVTNPFLVRMNQDPLGLQAYVASRSGEAYVLVKDAEYRFGTARYVALYNASDKRCSIRLAAKDVDLDGEIAAFDLVERADIGTFRDEVSVEVDPHAAKFYLLDAEKRLDRTAYEAETAYLTDYSEIHKSPNGVEAGMREQGRAYWTANALASGGVAVVNLGMRTSNDLVWKDVKLSSGGNWRFKFRCASKERRSFMLEVDGGAPIALATDTTNGAFVDVFCTLRIPAGVHTIRLSNAWAPMPDIDRLDIEFSGTDNNDTRSVE